MRIHMLTFEVSFQYGRRDKLGFWFHASQAIRAELEGLIKEYSKEWDPRFEYPHKVYINVGTSEVDIVDWSGTCVHVGTLSEPIETSNTTLNRLQTMMDEHDKKQGVKPGWRTQIAFISENIEKNPKSRSETAEWLLFRMRTFQLILGLKERWKQFWSGKNSVK